MPFRETLKTVALVNANISSGITDDMVEIARQSARGQLEIVGLTAPFGAQLITCEAELDEAARAILALAPEIRADAVIVSAFGDPAAEALGRSAQPTSRGDRRGEHAGGNEGRPPLCRHYDHARFGAAHF